MSQTFRFQLIVLALSFCSLGARQAPTSSTQTGLKTLTASGSYNVLVSCEKGSGATPEVFLSFINETLETKDAKITGKVELPHAVTVFESTAFTEKKEFVVVSIPEKPLYEYILKEHKAASSEPQEPGGYPAPENVASVFTFFQMASAGGCEIMTPTRLELFNPITRPEWFGL